MSPLKSVLTAGFAMFSMFFGSGNLVFPLHLGQVTQSMALPALLGFLLTAVLVPFLGLLGIVLFNGDRNKYFSDIGKAPSFLLMFLMLCLIGPLGVIPRCVTVSFGGFATLFPSLPLWAFSAVFCSALAALIWQPNRIVEIIGIFLTPVKLGSLLLLICLGLWLGGTPEPSTLTFSEAFTQGIGTGYHTMDLMAAFFFSCTVMAFLKRQASTFGQHISTKTLFKHGLFASMFGALLLSLVYAGFFRLGAEYGGNLKEIPPEALLAVISGKALGSFATPLISAIIAFSCLVTATILSGLFAEFLQIEISCKNIPYKVAVLITVGISFALSLLGFQTIMGWLGSMLEWLYPLLIVYAMWKIVDGMRQYNSLD